MIRILVKGKINRGLIKSILEKKRKLFHHNIEFVIRNNAIPALIDNIMRGYDDLTERARSAEEDPTNPVHWRELFKAHLEQELQQNFIFIDGRIIIKLGDKSFLGYDPDGETNDPADSEPLSWMVYYIEGLAGEWAFITPDLYEQFRGAGSFQNWGRLGNGFLISKEQYESEGWETVMPFNEVRHPFSGYSPVDIFEEAVKEFQLRPFIQLAIKASVAGREL